MAKDFYKILGLDRTADDRAVKAAYRKLARKYHPDLNPNDKEAENRFKEVQEAYEVLSDPEKRAKYDRFGANWDRVVDDPSQWGGSGVNFDPGDLGSIFSQFFGGGGFSEADVAQPRNRGAQPSDVEKTVELTLEEIDSGTKRTLTYQVNDSCKTCDGTGQVRLRQPKPCRQCGGSGQMRSVFGVQPCTACHGRGRTDLEACPTCSGAGVLPTTKRVEVTIPAGIQEGKKLRVPGKGSMGANGRAGDLYVLVKELPHSNFKRKGDDLETEVTVPYYRALLGGEIKVDSIRPGSLSMRIPECTQSGQTFRLADQGLSLLGGKRGNLLVRVKIGIPKALSSEEKDLLKKIEAGQGVQK
ncbi:MAG: J domain-containing protein [Armatimonadetes bacterium]|nr:J domain-containing protein [Armatimonadota bacterium]